MSLLSSAGKLAVKGVTKLKGVFIKTSGKLGALAGKETAEELAIQGGRKISKEGSEKLIKSETNYFVDNILKSKPIKYTGIAGTSLLLGGGAVAGTSAITGKGIAFGYDIAKSSLSQTPEQAQRAKDIELAEKELKIQTDYDKLMNEQREKDLKYFADYKKIMGDSGDTMSYDEFKAWLEEQNANRNSDLDNLLGSGRETTTTTNNSKWLYLLGGLGLVGAGYLIYKKGKKGKK